MSPSFSHNTQDLSFPFLTSLEEALPACCTVQVCAVPLVPEGGGDHRITTEELVGMVYCGLLAVRSVALIACLELGLERLKALSPLLSSYMRSLYCLVVFSAALVLERGALVRSAAPRLSVSGSFPLLHFLQRRLQFPAYCRCRSPSRSRRFLPYRPPCPRLKRCSRRCWLLLHHQHLSESTPFKLSLLKSTKGLVETP